MKQTKDQIKNKQLMKTYGITLSQWVFMSSGGCAICGRTTGRICVDHVHVKGFKKMSSEDKKKYVRGALCFLCNTGIKGFDKTCSGTENRKRLRGTYDYFKMYPLKGEI